MHVLPACETAQGQQLEALLWSSWPPDGKNEEPGTQALRDFDQRVDALLAQLRADAASPAATSLEGQLAAELRDRLRSDLLYLSVTRRYAEGGVPPLPSFESPDNRTWAMSGGAPQWRALAGDAAFDAPLERLPPEVDAAMRTLALRGHEYCSGAYDAYIAWELGALRGQPAAGGGAFAEFIRQLKPAVKQALLSVGGASGLPDRNRTEEEAPVAPVIPGEEALEHLALIGAIMENTRAAQADLYLGHVLCGLCVRRLGRRFQVLRSAGMLPALPEAAPRPVPLESSSVALVLQDAQRSRSAALFEGFMEDLVSAAPDGGVEVLQQALALSPVLLAAARRHTNVVFGRGLREEVFRPLTRASRAAARPGGVAPAARTEATAALMLDAANGGELRMLSAGPVAQARLLRDGALFGALLGDAEDALAGGTLAAE